MAATACARPAASLPARSSSLAVAVALGVVLVTTACAGAGAGQPRPAGGADAAAAAPATAPGASGPLSPRDVLGAAWSRAATLVVWPNRDGHAAVVHDGKLWVLGGWGAGPLADVWSSDDGESWRQVLAAAPWEARKGHAAVEWGGRLWVLGGSLGAESAADVWSSADGVAWQRATEAVPWGPRNEHAVVVFGDELWLLGGWSAGSESGNRNDVWRSADGATWERVVEAAPWSPRNGHAAVVHDGRLWVIGGWGGREDGGEGNLGDVWSSVDGVTWERTTAAAPWSRRNGHAVVAAAGRMWLLGGWADGAGEDGGEGNVADVWWSRDGVAWVPATARAPWLPRNGHAGVVFAGRLWVVGGWSHFVGGTSVNDLWYSELGP